MKSRPVAIWQNTIQQNAIKQNSSWQNSFQQNGNQLTPFEKKPFGEMSFGKMSQTANGREVKAMHHQQFFCFHLLLLFVASNSSLVSSRLKNTLLLKFYDGGIWSGDRNHLHPLCQESKFLARIVQHCQCSDTGSALPVPVLNLCFACECVACLGLHLNILEYAY